MTIAERSARRLTMGGIIVQTFHVISENPLLFFGLSIILAIPSLIHRYEQVISGDVLSISHSISVITYILCGYLVTVAAAKAVVLNTAGHRASLQACLVEIARNFFAVTALAIIASFVFVAAILVSPVFPFALILLLPGFLISVFLFVVVPVRTVERTDIIRTLSRSMELTRGHRWLIIAFSVVFIILGVAYQAVLYAALGGPAVVESTSALPAQVLLLSVGDTATAVIGAVATAIIYFQLRLMKEGVAPDAVAAEFE